MHTYPGHVKSYPEIAEAAMHDRLDLLYRIWILVRYLDPIGRGRVAIKDLRHFVKHQHLFSLRTLERAIAKDCIFYHRFQGYLETHSFRKVAAALGVEVRLRPVWIPLDDFSSIGKLRAALLASRFAHKPQTVAHATLAKETGRSTRTVGRYTNSEHIAKTPNVMQSDRDPNTVLTPEEHQEGWFHTRRAGKTVLAKRMPNTYQTDLEPAAYGQVKQQRLSPLSAPMGGFRRRYFHHSKGARRALQALSPGETVYLRSGNCFDDFRNQIWRGFWCLHPDSFHRSL